MSIINNPGFHWLMKTGRPHYQIPSSRTVAHDVHVVFKRVKEWIAKMLQVSFVILYFVDNVLTMPQGIQWSVELRD